MHNRITNNLSPDDINVIGFVKGPDKFILLYNDSDTAEALQSVDRWATHPEINFTWYDAGNLTKRIKETYKEACDEHSINSDSD